MKSIKILYSIIIFVIFLQGCDTYSHINSEDKNIPKRTFTSTPFEIDKKLDEISGLQLVCHDYFYGFNDSGGKAEVYKVNNKGDIIQTIRLSNAKNKDWESIAINDSLIFIADVGNNVGNRKDLCIYYFDRRNINSQEAKQEIQCKKISFHYPEQTSFNLKIYNHDFDCEAIAWFNGKLHLFTKEWKSKHTHHYTLELTEEPQAAKLIDSYDSKFLVTGADILKIDENSSLLALIGYSKIGTVHLIRTIIPNNQEKLLVFPKENTYLGNTGTLGQVEGISIASPDVFYYSAEDYKSVPQHITKLEIK